MSEPLELETSSAPTDMSPAEPAILHAFISDAAADEASDIHIDPVTEGFAVRHRVNGDIVEKLRLADEEGRRLINQVRVTSELPIDIGHRPQEGRFTWHATAEESEGDTPARRDVRVTIIPSPKGQSVHLRLLQAPRMLREFGTLGMTDEQMKTIKQSMHTMHGLALIGGRTGAGKTTTLYSMADMLGPDDYILASVEDPIEFDVPAMRQIEVDEEHGMSMSDGLRVLTRTDPDVMLIGEVRDQFSAATAGRAALTGRLVLATIHAPDAAGAIESMRHHAVPTHVLGGAVRLVIGQDLARLLCHHCSRSRKPNEDERELFEAAGVQPPEEVAEPVGCDKCFKQGYAGRTGVYEVAEIDPDTSAWLARGQHRHAIRRRLIENGMEPMHKHALRKAARGVTSVHEVRRIGIDLPHEAE